LIAKLTRLLTLVLIVIVTSHAQAREKVLGMSKKVYDSISEIQLLIDAEQWDEGLAKLQAQRERKMNGYETAHVLNMLGYTYYQLDRIPEAMSTYQEALSQEGLPGSQVRALLMTVSQLALVSEDWQSAEKYAKQLLQIESDVPVDPMAYVILAQAYVGQERYADAKEPLLTAINRQKEAGTRPRENWMALLSSVYFMLEDYESMRELLYYMVSLYPKEQYLLNLAALHGQLGDTDKQLALVESLLDGQHLERGQHLLSLANLFMAHGLPYKAASLLNKEIESGRIEANKRNLELESQAWYLAGEEERAIPPLERAADVAEDADLYLRVARLYMDIYNYEKAYQAAVEAEKLSEEYELGDTLLLQGMALARDDELERAKKIFRRAAEYEESQKWANQWLRFVTNEQQRIAAFKEWQ
jgi:tetratricopeptide (TPR) repeat protein